MGTLLWWSCQSPVAHSWGLLNRWNSFHGGMFKHHAKFNTDPLLYLLSHFECDGHTVHMLTQWRLPPPLNIVQCRHHCSLMCVPAHSPWLPSYFDVMQTVLVTLTKAGLSPQTWYKHLYSERMPEGRKWGWRGWGEISLYTQGIILFFCILWLFYIEHVLLWH